MESMMKKRNLLAILLLSVYPQAFAYQPTAAELHNNSALCSYGYNSNCGYNNGYSSQKVNIIRLPDKYGAIAGGILPQGPVKYFSTFNEHSAKMAKNKALTMCRREANECRIVADYSNQCISSSIGTKKELYTINFGVGLTPDLANHDALKKCKNDNLEQCRLFSEVECSLPG